MDPQEQQPDLLQPQAAPAPPVVSARMIEALHQQCQDLRSLLNAACVALLVLVMAINLFVWKQARVVRQQLDELRPKFLQIEGEFQKVREPEYRRFIGRLQQYAMTHQDFQPIIARYRVILPQYFAASAPAMPAAEPAGNMAPAAPKPR